VLSLACNALMVTFWPWDYVYPACKQTVWSVLIPLSAKHALRTTTRLILYAIFAGITARYASIIKVAPSAMWDTMRVMDSV
jgi:hypothetical protein